MTVKYSYQDFNKTTIEIHPVGLINFASLFFFKNIQDLWSIYLVFLKITYLYPFQIGYSTYHTGSNFKKM